MFHPASFRIFIFISTILVSFSAQAAIQVDINAPVSNGTFGDSVAALPNGNVVVTDPTYDVTSPQLIVDAGAVFLYSPSGELISRITGNSANDNIGSGGIKVLSNGNYIFSSPNFDDATTGGTSGNNYLTNNTAGNSPLTNFPVKSNVGAVTLGFASTGISGVVSPANSLIGSFAQDRIGNMFILPNGNYLVGSILWNSNRGSVTFRNGTVLASGVVSAANSVVGDNPEEYVGNIKFLKNGNYVIYAPRWNQARGAVRLCNSQTGCSGSLSSANSLVGAASGDFIGNDGIIELANGNFVQVSTISNDDRGTVTLCNGDGSTTGEISSANTLSGGTANDYIGSGGITPLANGNFVILSPIWQNGGTRRGAATFGNGVTGVSGEINSSNSLIGYDSSSFFLSKIIALTNGNYVVSLPNIVVSGTNFLGAALWADGTTGLTGTVTTSNSLYRGPQNVVALTNGNYVVVSPSFSGKGAVTFVNGLTGMTGEVAESNSMVGNSNGDNIGFQGVFPLTNGNYVICSADWDNGAIQNAGAVTFCNGTNGCIGTVLASNSLVGTKAFDNVGFGGAIALTNGNYVVRSYQWDNGSNTNAGAATFGNGNTGIIGEVSPANSLVGSNTNDNIGINAITALPNGNYVVTSFSWNNRGAVTWGNGATGTTGIVSALNSVIGSSNDDRVGTLGNNPSIRVYSDSGYTFHSANWNNITIGDAGAVTLGKANSPVAGEINAENSVRGTTPNAGPMLTYDYNPQTKFLVVGRLNRIVTVFRYESNNPSFDFDGDGKTDIGIYRPPVGEWWITRSSTNQTFAVQFGTSSDKTVPADFTGDGKTDIAFWRESTGQWFILRSEDNSFYAFPFGQLDDIPAPGDFDGDGKADAAVFRPSTGVWYILRSSDGGVTHQQFGVAEDLPVVADYDGDGKDDIAVFRPSPSEWWLLRSSAGLQAVQFGQTGDKTVPADYTGDGKADIAFYRPASGEWFILQKEDNSFYAFPWGTTGDVSTPGDYDGDGRADAAVFRPSNSTWYLQRSTSGFIAIGFGTTGDQPIPNSYVRN